MIFRFCDIGDRKRLIKSSCVYACNGQQVTCLQLSFTVLVIIYSIIQSGLGLFLVAIAIAFGLTHACTPVCMQYTL